MPSFGAILGQIGVPLANTVAANNFAQKAEDDKQRQIAMTALAQMRQERIDADNHQREQAQTDYFNRGRLGNGLHYITDPVSGEVYAMPTTSGGAPSPTDRVPPPTNIPVPRSGPVAPPVGGVNAPTIPQGVVPRSTSPGVNVPGQPIDLNKSDTGQGPGTPIVPIPPDASQGGPPQGPTSPTIGRKTGITLGVKPTKAPVTPLPQLLAAKVAEYRAQGMNEQRAAEAARNFYAQPNAPAPASFTFNPSGVDANGNPVFAKGNTRTGELTTTGVGAKAPSAASMTRGFGQGGVFGAGSGIGSVEEMKSVLPNMKNFENQVGQGTVPLNGWDTFREGLISHAQANGGFIDRAKAQAVLDQLVRTNPALATYATDKLAWVMADLNLSRSSSDERGRLATVVDGLDLPIGSMDPTSRKDYISRMQNRRDARLGGLEKAAGAAGQMLNQVTNSLGRGGGRGGANPPPAGSGDPEFDALMASLKPKKP